MEPSVFYCACLAGGLVNENVKSVKQKALNSTETFFHCLLNPLRKKIAVSVQYNCSMLENTASKITVFLYCSKFAVQFKIPQSTAVTALLLQFQNGNPFL
jgi:hypothetical protein